MSGSQLESALLMQMIAAGVPTPEREHRMHGALGHRFDFAWPRYSIAVECEGGVFAGGRHNRGAGYQADTEKYNLAVLLGWSVLRFTGNQIDSGHALAVIEAALGLRPVEEILERRIQETENRRSAGAKLGWAIRKQKQADEENRK